MKRLLVLLLVLSLFLAACGGDDDENNENESNGGDATSAAVDTAALIENAAQQLESAESFQLELEATGAPVLLNSETIGLEIPVAFQRAAGVFVAPNSIQAKVGILLEDVVTEVDMVTVGAEQFLKHNFITANEWRAMQFSPTFSPDTLISGDQSIPAALRTLESVEYIEETELDGVEVHHIRAQVDAAKVSAVTVGLIGTTEGKITANVYIRSDTGRLERLVLEEPINPEIDPENPTVWTIALYDYNGDYTITKPEVEG
jgi:hypothetical protein